MVRASWLGLQGKGLTVRVSWLRLDVRVSWKGFGDRGLMGLDDWGYGLMVRAS
jgi:hypothetical protein